MKGRECTSCLPSDCMANWERQLTAQHCGRVSCCMLLSQEKVKMQTQGLL